MQSHQREAKRLFLLKGGAAHADGEEGIGDGHGGAAVAQRRHLSGETKDRGAVWVMGITE